MSGSVIRQLNLDTVIRERVRNGYSHEEIASELQMSYPTVDGLSKRSVTRYCSQNNIHYASRLRREELDDVVEQAVYRVGPSYGRRTLTGLLRSEGVVVGEQRVRSAMRTVTPVYIEQRQQRTYRQINPIPYYAQYHGHKIHFDQNEKLVRFGVTHVAASDGYSGKILGITSMPVKNCITIYEDLYRPIVVQHGLWDQVRVDGGREFSLILHVQDLLSPFRTNTHRTPYVQTQSKQNHIAERHWVEVNTRVNYPLKSALRWMQENEVFELECPGDKYCVSLMTGILCQVGIQLHTSSWNNHRIPGAQRGVPNTLARNNDHAARVPAGLIPNIGEAVASYEETGGVLSPMTLFGSDPLSDNPVLIQQRQRELEQALPSPQDVFAHTVNGDFGPFAQSIDFFIQSTSRLQRQL